MNLDVFKENPSWTWYPVAGGPILGLVLMVWLVFKYSRVCYYIPSFLLIVMNKLTTRSLNYGPKEYSRNFSTGFESRSEAEERGAMKSLARLRRNQKVERLTSE